MVINKPEWKCDGPQMVNGIGWCYTTENAKPIKIILTTVVIVQFSIWTHNIFYTLLLFYCNSIQNTHNYLYIYFFLDND